MARTSVATDNFNRGSLGSNWTQLNSAWGSLGITGNDDIIGAGANAVGNSQVARWVGTGTFTDDQYSEIVVASLAWISTAYRIGVCVRASADTNSNRDFYEFCVAGNASSNYTTYLGKVVNGTWTQLHSAAIAWSAGDTLELEAEGTTIRAMRNGVALGGSWTQTDTSLTTGKPGVVASGNSSSVAGDDWEGGNITGSGGVVIPVIVNHFKNQGIM